MSGANIKRKQDYQDKKDKKMVAQFNFEHDYSIWGNKKIEEDSLTLNNNVNHYNDDQGTFTETPTSTINNYRKETSCSIDNLNEENLHTKSQKKRRDTISDIFEARIIDPEFLETDSEDDSSDDEEVISSKLERGMFDTTAEFCILKDTDRIISTMIYNLKSSTNRDITHLYPNSDHSTGIMIKINLFYFL